MPKHWQSVEKDARLNRAISVLGSQEVKELRPDGLTDEECCALLLSNKACTSIPMAKSTIKELHWAGRLVTNQGLYSVPGPKENDIVENPKAIFDKYASAVAGIVDKSSFKSGQPGTTNQGVIEE